MALDSFVWKTKKERALALKSPVKRLWIPKTLKGLVYDLKAMHAAQEVIVGNPQGADVQSDNGFGILF